MNSVRLLAIPFLAGLLTISPAMSGDWPQILGPQRRGIAEAEQLADHWPEEGPAVVWKLDVGAGNAGVAVVGDWLVLFHRVDDDETVSVLNARTGSPIWAKSYPTSFAAQVGGNDGPTCVPTIAGERVVTYGPLGVLSCWSLNDGTLHWQRDTHDDFGALEGYFGAGSSPLVDGDRVIVNVGGAKENAGIVAFDLKTGRDLWTSTDERPSYSAPIAATLDGRRMIVCLARLSCVGLDPKSGTVLFSVPFGQRGPTVNAATPLVLGDRLFLTSSYGVGAMLLDVNASGAKPVWRKGDVMSSQYTTPILHEQVLIGIDGRDDIPPAHLRCVDPQSGRVLWSEDNFGYATLVKGGSQLIIVKTDGELVLAEADRSEYQPLSRHQLTRGTLRALPALSDGRLYVRDERTLFCLDVGPRK